MKLTLCFFFLIQFSIFSQYNGGGELFFYNSSNQDVTVRIYPVSAVFNNDHDLNGYYGNYNLVMTNRVQSAPTKDFINGTSVNSNLQGQRYFLIPSGYPENENGRISFGFDDVGGSDEGTAGTIGFGIWRIEFFWNCHDPEDIYEWPFCYPDEFFTIEFDYGYMNANRNVCGQNPADIEVHINTINNQPTVQYQWRTCECAYPNSPLLNLPLNRKLYERDRGCEGQSWPKDIAPMGKFKYNYGRDIIAPNPYSVMPLDPRYYCTDDFFPQSYSENENHFFVNDDIGKIILNLTVEKNVTTPIHPWDEQLYSFPPIIITNDATMKIAKGTNGQERTFIFKKYQNYLANTPLEVHPYSTLELEGSSIANERSHMYFESYSHSLIWQSGHLTMGENSLIDLTGNADMKLKGASYVAQYAGSRINIRNNALLYNCGAIFTVTNQAQIALFDNGRYIISNKCPEDFTDAFESEVNQGSSIEMNDNSNLTIEANCKLIFDGQGSYLKTSPGTTINLGLGASIEFRNGAYIDANGCTFTSMNSGEVSSGVKLIGAGSNSIIQNCTFNDANIAIDVQNTSCTLLNNTINIPPAELGAAGINTSNVTSITIQHNTINIGSNASATGINMLNYDGDGLAGGIGVPTYALNVINNFINGGSYPLSISCLTANRLPFLIKGNIITPLTGITNYGIFAYNISGNIKNNIFSNNQAANSLALQQSDVNLFDNSFLSGSSTTMLLQSGTTARMAPIQDENGQWLWIGGNNSFNSNSSNNIGFTLGSNPIVTPFGSNCFYLGTMPNYFISGEFCGGRSYNAYENYWEPTPTSGTYNILCSGIPQYVNYTPYYTECPMIIGGTSTGYVVEDAGNGIYDTVYTSPGEGGEGGSVSSVSKESTISEGRLYYEALTKRRQHDYAGAIGKCKDIINSSDTSDYYISALSELYLNYQQSDTIDNQNITSGLFNNLKTYLEQKMSQYANNPVFVEKAYKYILMCLVKSKNYTEALAGYENIMNNHPDQITRLNASWDRSAVVLLMGQGGSVSSNFKQNSLNRLLDNKPSHRIAKDVFKSAKDNELAGNERSAQRKYTQEEKTELNNRIEKYNPISNKDLKEKLLSDIRLVNTINSVNRSAEDNNTLSPRRFTLYQNYPNPFNPATMIKYDIPKDAVVKVKVYDILGKQVFGLDEFKKAGSYEVRFDGENLASGMYFYSVEANGFKETKKMVLLK